MTQRPFCPSCQAPRRATPLLLAAGALVLAAFSTQPVFADAPVEDPFLWMDSGAPAPAPERPTAPPTKYEPAPQAVVVPAPAAPAPVAHSNCYTPDGRPMTLDFPNGPMLSAHAGHQGHAYDARRGYMAGDDGVLRGIQDNPCVEIYRRGGETPESAAGWLHPHDIRRVNTLEDRRIPIHSVGRYAANPSELWYADPANPYIEAAREWDVREGETLSTLLRRWGAEAGYTISYQTQADYIIEANSIIRGTFPEAAGAVIASFKDAKPAVAAKWHPSNRAVQIISAAEFDGR